MSEIPGGDNQMRKVVEDGPPPFLGTWPKVYAAVLLYATLLIVAFYLFTRAFNR